MLAALRRVNTAKAVHQFVSLSSRSSSISVLNHVNNVATCQRMLSTLISTISPSTPQVEHLNRTSSIHTLVSPIMNGLNQRQSSISVAACQSRGMALLALHRLKPTKGSHKKKKRVGRGRSSGLGKTSGRGQKGHGARVGRVSLVRYEGGGTMLWRRTPKRGFRKGIPRELLEPLAIERVVAWVAAGRLDASKPITMKDLRDSNCVGRFRYGVKLLHSYDYTAVHRLPVPLHLEVSHCSESVKAAVEANGGSVKFIYYSRLGLRHLLKPGSLSFIPRPSVPKPKKALRYELQSVGRSGRALVKRAMAARIKRKIRVKR